MNDLTDLLARAEWQREGGRPFVLYRKPGGESVLGLFQQDTTVRDVVDFTESGYVFAPFEGPALLIPESASERVSIPWNAGRVSLSKAVITEDEDAKARHIALVEQGIAAIRKGKFAKVVLSRKQEIDTKEGFSIIFTRLLNAYPDAFAYVFYSRASGLWMGAFSEQLAHLSGHYLTTMALAGTRLSGDETEWGRKEQEEQHYVTDAIVEGLRPFAEKIRKGDTETIRAGRLEHIRTMLLAQLRQDADPRDWLHALHPTPAVCGQPKEAARRFIQENEGYDREFYAGFHGELNVGWQTDLFVNLRCLKWEQGQATLFIGGGVTIDSDPLKEWEETVNKAGTMGALL